MPFVSVREDEIPLIVTGVAMIFQVYTTPSSKPLISQRLVGHLITDHELYEMVKNFDYYKMNCLPLVIW